MSTSSRFDRFISNISLSAAQRQDAQDRVKAVASKLHEHYYQTVAYTGSTKLIIGSHAKRTRVRPPRDVDIIFIMPILEYSRYNNYAGNGQSQMLQDVRAVIAKRYPNTSISSNGRVVDVKFTAGHSVQVVPAFEVSGKFLLADSHNGGSWQVSDYREEAAYIDRSDKATAGNTRKLIKMLKVWQQECNAPIRSLALELRAVNFLKKWPHSSKSSVYHDWMMRDFFKELLNYTNGSCQIPGITEKCHYGDAWATKARRAHANAAAACEDEANGYEYLATEHWQKIFGTMYVGP